MIEAKELEALLVDKKHISIEGIVSVNDDNFGWLPDNSIDLVLTDPPFNIARDTNFHTYEKNTINSFRFDEDKGWDTYTPEGFKNLLSDWAKEFARVLRPGGSFAIFCADEYLSFLISSLKDAGLKPRRTLSWRKPNAVPVNRKHMMMSACEYVVLGVKGSNSVFNADLNLGKDEPFTSQEVIAIADKAATVIDLEIRKALQKSSHRLSVSDIQKLVSNVITSQAEESARRSINIYSEDESLASLCVPNYVSFNSKAGNRLHPTEKPVQLLSYLTELLSNPGDLVLDPFSGSASMGETAIQTGRRAVLVERDEEFFEKGASRLRNLQEQNESKLF